jgi:hypothetical protein
MPKKKKHVTPLVRRPKLSEIQESSSPTQQLKPQVEKLKQEDLDKLLSEDAEKFLNQNRQKGGE